VCVSFPDDEVFEAFRSFEFVKKRIGDHLSFPRTCAYRKKKKEEEEKLNTTLM